MSHLAALKHDGSLHFVTLFQKRQNVIPLHIEIVVGSLRAEFDFLELNGLLVFLGLVLPFAELVEKLSIIDDPANRRIRRR